MGLGRGAIFQLPLIVCEKSTFRFRFRFYFLPAVLAVLAVAARMSARVLCLPFRGNRIVPGAGTRLGQGGLGQDMCLRAGAIRIRTKAHYYNPPMTLVMLKKSI